MGWTRIRVRQFGVPIRDAIDHVVMTSPRSLSNSERAERHFFEVLHEQTCSGDLLVIGRKGKTNAPMRISARKCKQLKPMEVVVGCSPTSPRGVRLSLFGGQTSEFTGLRLRSRDLYRIWPKDPMRRWMEECDEALEPAIVIHTDGREEEILALVCSRPIERRN